MFNTNDIGLMESGAKERIPIIAKYPDAPACPTVEYNIAIIKNRKAISEMCSIVMFFFIFFKV